MRVRGEKLHCCIQMPSLNCCSRAGVFSLGYYTEFHSDACCWLLHLGCLCVFGGCGYVSKKKKKKKIPSVTFGVEFIQYRGVLHTVGPER